MPTAARRRRKLPSICLDEHIPEAVGDAFRSYRLRVIETSKHSHLRGRDEHDYLRELYAQNSVFFTSDVEFVERSYRVRPKHAGAVYVPAKLSLAHKRISPE